MEWEEYKMLTIPNFIRRVDDNFPTPFGELSDVQITKIGTAFTKALLERAKQQRKNKTEGWNFDK